MYASAQGRVDVIDFLLRNGADINAKDKNGENALMVAAMASYEEIFAVPKDFDVNKKCELKLVYTKGMGDYRGCAEILIENSVDINAQDNFGKTALMMAVTRGNISFVQKLLEYDIGVNVCDINGENALKHVLYEWKQTKKEFRNNLLNQRLVYFSTVIASLLIKHGADINNQNKNGGTLLMEAILFRHMELVDLLLYHGADILLRTEDGMNALMVATQVGNLKLVKELIRLGGNIYDVSNDLLSIAAVNGQYNIVEWLINQGVDINYRLKRGWTPLMRIASACQDVQAIKMLVRYGADINARSDMGGTVLAIAAEFNSNPQIIEFLIECGMSINICNQKGGTPFSIACETNHSPQVIESFIKHGANVNIRTNAGRSPLLDAAALNPNPNVIMTLIKYGANIFSKDDEGYSILDYIQHNEKLKQHPKYWSFYNSIQNMLEGQ